MKISKELLKGSTTMLVLDLLKNQNMYGYEMIKKLKEKLDITEEKPNMKNIPKKYKLKKKDK